MARSTLTASPRLRQSRSDAGSREPRKPYRQRFNVLGHPEYNALPDEPAPGVEERIASVMPFIAKEAMRIARDLTPRQRARIGVDDLIQEAWCILLLRDHSYNPARYPFERGGYLGFARMTIRQHFRRVLGSAYPVQLPKDVADRCKGALDKPDVAKAVECATRAETPLPPNSLTTGDDPTIDAAE